MCYCNKELDGDQKAWGQWLGLYWDYVGVAGRLGGGVAYDSGGWTKSTS